MENDQQLWIVFLDIDGVIATVESGYDESGTLFCDTAVYWLNELLTKYNFQIVVSSNWRLRHNFSELEEILSPLKAQVISITPVLKERGLEIKNWLETNTWNHRYLVIDDYTEDIKPYIHKEHIIEVEVGFENNGFSKNHFIEAVRKIEVLK